MRFGLRASRKRTCDRSTIKEGAELSVREDEIKANAISVRFLRRSLSFFTSLSFPTHALSLGSPPFFAWRLNVFLEGEKNKWDRLDRASLFSILSAQRFVSSTLFNLQFWKTLSFFQNIYFQARSTDPLSFCKQFSRIPYRGWRITIGGCAW